MKEASVTPTGCLDQAVVSCSNHPLLPVDRVIVGHEGPHESVGSPVGGRTQQPVHHWAVGLIAGSLYQLGDERGRIGLVMSAQPSDAFSFLR